MSLIFHLNKNYNEFYNDYMVYFDDTFLSWVKSAHPLISLEKTVGIE